MRERLQSETIISLSHNTVARDLAFPEVFESFHDVISNNASIMLCKSCIKLITPSCLSTHLVSHKPINWCLTYLFKTTVLLADAERNDTVFFNYST